MKRLNAGEPIRVSGEWALIERVVNEYDAQSDGFRDFYILRFADGGQAKLTWRELTEDPAWLEQYSTPDGTLIGIKS